MRKPNVQLLPEQSVETRDQSQLSTQLKAEIASDRSEMECGALNELGECNLSGSTREFCRTPESDLLDVP